MIDEGKATLYELLTGIVVLMLLELLGNLFAPNRLAYTLGLLLGVIVAAAMGLHMYYSIEKAILYDVKTATNKTKLAAGVRVLFMCAGVTAAALLPKYLSVAGVVLGILNLKFSAYLQPLTHKVFQKFINKGR